MGRVERISIRHGNTVAHVSTPEEAVAIMRALASPPSSTKAEDAQLLSCASDFSQRSLEALCQAYPQLSGAATRSIGTALRVAQVRSDLCGISVRGTPILKVLGWTAAAADAQRHLTQAVIQEAHSKLLEITSAVPVTHIGKGISVLKRAFAGWYLVATVASKSGAIDEFTMYDANDDWLSVSSSQYKQERCEVQDPPIAYVSDFSPKLLV